MNDRNLVDVDAGLVFRHPLRAMLVVTFVAGSVDAVGFREFGGSSRPIRLATSSWSGSSWSAIRQPALLTLASVLGLSVGVVTVVVRVLTGDGPAGAPAPFATTKWWYQAASVATTSFSLAALATVLIAGAV